MVVVVGRMVQKMIVGRTARAKIQRFSSSTTKSGLGLVQKKFAAASGMILRPAQLTAAQHRFKSSSLSLGDKAEEEVVVPPPPSLVEVPSLPVFGSMVPAYSGTPSAMDQSSVFEFWPEMRRRFGDFYSFGLPGVGSGIRGTAHVIQDPHEMARIVRLEGKFPSGAAEFAWAMKKYLADRKAAASALLSHGPEWKRIRSFLQTDLLSPASARRYLPLVIEAAPHISRGAPHYQDDMNAFLNLASFEMFSNVMLGRVPRVVDPTHQADPEDALFCESVANALRANSNMMQSAWEPFASKMGYETHLYNELRTNYDVAQGIADKKVDALMTKKKGAAASGQQLSANEEACYASVAFDRAAAEGSDVTVEEAKTVVGGLLSAGVDTTGGLLSFKLLHVAGSPEAQDRIYRELQANGGEITPDSVSAAHAPYLHACLRESHRLANSNVMIPMKHIPQQVSVHGVELPPNSLIILDGYSTGVDPELLDEPMEFRPERFLKEAIEARRGTPSQAVDHVFFSGPFSQGARKCPGSRVANLETAVLLAQLVKDWEMALPSTVKHWTDVPYGLDTVTTAQLPPMEFSPRTSA